MSTRKPDKPKNARQQAWLDAARRALRKKGVPPPKPAPHLPPTTRPEGVSGDYDEEEVIIDALLDMAGDDLIALPPDADDAALDGIVGIAVLAYNHLLDDLIPLKEGETESHGDFMRRALEASFARTPGLREMFHRMLAVRKKCYGHLLKPVMDCKATWGKNRTVDVVITFGALPPGALAGGEAQGKK